MPIEAAERRDGAPPGLSAICARGFEPIAGTRTCVKISGRVRSEASFGKRGQAGFGSEGRVRLEAQTSTDYGPARGVIEMRAGNLRSRSTAPYMQ